MGNLTLGWNDVDMFHWSCLQQIACSAQGICWLSLYLFTIQIRVIYTFKSTNTAAINSIWFRLCNCMWFYREKFCDNLRHLPTACVLRTVRERSTRETKASVIAFFNQSSTSIVKFYQFLSKEEILSSNQVNAAFKISLFLQLFFTEALISYHAIMATSYV